MTNNSAQPPYPEDPATALANLNDFARGAWIRYSRRLMTFNLALLGYGELDMTQAHHEFIESAQEAVSDSFEALDLGWQLARSFASGSRASVPPADVGPIPVPENLEPLAPLHAAATRGATTTLTVDFATARRPLSLIAYGLYFEEPGGRVYGIPPQACTLTPASLTAPTDHAVQLQINVPAATAVGTYLGRLRADGINAAGAFATLEIREVLLDVS